MSEQDRDIMDAFRSDEAMRAFGVQRPAQAGPTEIWTLGDHDDVGLAVGPVQIERVETEPDDPITRFRITRRIYRVVRDELGRWIPAARTR